MLVPLTLAALLRCLYVAKPDIGNDECFSLFYAQYGLGDIVRTLAQGDNPPLWELLLHFWIMAFGVGVVSLRALSVVFSVATVVPIYLSGERFVGRHAGLAAAMVYAFCTFSIFLSHDGRVYSLVGMLAAWSAYLFLLLLNDDSHRRRRWVWLTVVNLLIMYCHYLAIWVVVAEAVTVLVHGDSRKRMWRGGLVHIGALAIGYIPMYPVLWQRFLDSGLHGTWIQRSTGVQNLYFMLGSYTNAPVVTALTMLLTAAAAVYSIVLIAHRKATFGNTARLTLMWTVPAVVSFGLSFLVGFLFNRYFYFLVPTYLLSLTAYAYRLAGRAKWLQWLLPAVLVLLMAVSVKPDSRHVRYGGWKGDTSAVAARIVEATAHGNANVVLAPEWVDKQVVYYLDLQHETFRTKGRLEEPVFEPYLTQQGWFYGGSEYTPQRDTVLLVHEQWQDIGNEERRLTDLGYTRTANERFQQMEILTYAR